MSLITRRSGTLVDIARRSRHAASAWAAPRAAPFSERASLIRNQAESGSFSPHGRLRTSSQASSTHDVRPSSCKRDEIPACSCSRYATSLRA
jgi:hypothetical protein